MDDTFSLVIPCYNEAKSLPDLVERVLACARRRDLTPDRFRLVLVENGSTDDSRSVLDRILAAPGGEFIDVVTVSPNRGYGNGIRQGLLAARPGILAWTHADGQCDPEDAFRGFDIVRASGAAPQLVKGRRHGRALPERVVSTGFATLATLLLGRRLGEINAQPKVFRSALLAHLPDPPSDFAFDFYVLARALEAGYALREIDVQFPPRRHGQSNWAATTRSKARTIARFVRYMVRYRLGRGA